MFIPIFFLVFQALAQVSRPTLKEISFQINKSLPDVYDQITKLNTTSVENNNMYFHFVVKANKEEFSNAFPKVRAQILKTICSKPREKNLLKEYKSNIVYRYESDRGLSLGEFMVKPDQCL